MGIQFNAVARVIRRINDYNFKPVSPRKEGFTVDPDTGKDGVPDLQNIDWLVRTLAICDLVRLGKTAISEIIAHSQANNPHVRQVCAMVPGILGAALAAEALEERLKEDCDSIVRSYAAISIGQIGQKKSLPILKESAESDPNRDIRHQCKLAIYQIEKGIKPTSELAARYASLDESNFKKIEVGKPAVDFTLQDTKGKKWRLSDFRGKKSVVLIWVFADWCPVCHNEFHELIELEKEFTESDIQVFTVECHDLYRCRVMVGEEEILPEYWFAKESPQKLYTKKIWWPHLVDLAGAVGATYGVDPLEFAVHSEWINRPSTIIVDKEGIARFASYGSYWGDRPTIKQILDIIQAGK